MIYFLAFNNNLVFLKKQQKMIQEFVKSLWAYVAAFGAIVRFRLWKYFILLILLLGLFALPVLLLDYLLDLLLGWIPYGNPEKYALMGVNIVAGLSGFVLLIVLSPLFSLVSEEVTQKLSGKAFRFSVTQLFKDVLRGIRITLRNMIYQYAIIALISVLLYLLPDLYLFEVIGTGLIILFTAYFYGFSILDYAMENHRMGYKASVDFVRAHPGMAIGLGTVYYLIIRINDIPIFKDSLQHYAIYWSGFAEAIVAFIGVIAASMVLHKVMVAGK